MLHRSPRRALFSALLAGLLGVSLGAGPRTIREVRVLGLQELEPPLVRLLMSSQAGSPLSSEALRADEQALLDSGMFRTARIEWAPLDDEGAALEVEVEEAPPVREVQVLGTDVLDEDSLGTWIRERIKGVPRPSDVAAVQKEVRRRYREQGLFACGLRSEEPLQLGPQGDLRVFLSEPVLGRVEVVGNQRVPVGVIRRKLVVSPGQVVRQEDLDESVRRLAQLGTLRSARFEAAEFRDGDRVVDLRLVVIEERYFGDLAVGARFERVNGAVSTFSLTRRNLFGSAVTLRADAEIGVRQSYGLRFQSDWLGGWPISGEAGVHLREILREARDGGFVSSRLEERREGQAYRLWKTLRDGLQVNVGLRDEDVRAQAVEGFLLPPNLALIGGNPLLARYVHQGIQLGVSRGPAYQPLTRERDRAWRLDYEFAGGDLFKGPGDYDTLRVEARRLLALGEDAELAVRARVGAIYLDSGILPFLERLAVGGSEDLRGLLFKERTGDRMALVNLEYRRRLHPKWTAVAFADYGDAWDNGLRDFDGSLSLGLGARVDISLFLLRLDLAKEVGGGNMRVTFGVGHLF
jgi:outer membrane protein insertion porin family